MGGGFGPVLLLGRDAEDTEACCTSFEESSWMDGLGSIVRRECQMVGYGHQPLCLGNKHPALTPNTTTETHPRTTP